MAQLLTKLEFLHQGHIRHAAHLLEQGTPNEQTLVTGNPAPKSKPNCAFQLRPAQEQRRMAKLFPKSTSSHAGIGQAIQGRTRPIWRYPRIGMEE